MAKRTILDMNTSALFLQVDPKHTILALSGKTVSFGPGKTVSFGPVLRRRR